MFRQEAGDSYTKADLEKFFKDFKRLVSPFYFHFFAIIMASLLMRKFHKYNPPVGSRKRIQAQTSTSTRWSK